MKKKVVELTYDQSLNSKWKVKHDGYEGVDEASYPKVDVGTHGPHLIVFKLAGDATFHRNEPIWIGPTKPNHKDVDPQITASHVSDDGKMLVILDNNTQKGQLHYRLNMQSGKDYLDPIIENGGIPPSMPTFDFVWLGIATAVALIVSFVAGFFVHKRFFT